jgi:hypothetical protein
MIKFLDAIDLINEEATLSWITGSKEGELQDYLDTHAPTTQTKQKIMQRLAQLRAQGGKQSDKEQQTPSKDTPDEPIVTVGKQYRSQKNGDIYTVIELVNNGLTVVLKSSKGDRLEVNAEKFPKIMDPV